MTSHESLYGVLKLRDYASTEEVEDLWLRFSDENRLANAQNQTSDNAETAFRILRNLRQKQLYDMLLDAIKRSDRKLPRIASPTAEAELLELAVSVNVKLHPIAPMTYQVVKTEPTRILDNEAVNRFTFPVGEAFLAFTAIPFVAEFDPFDKYTVLIMADDPNARFPVPRNFCPVRIEPENQGLIVKVGLPNEPPRFNAAYINVSHEFYGPFNAASDFYFPIDSLEIARRFGLRNTKQRIRQTILQYYDALADALAHVDSRIDCDVAKRSFRKLAKSHHYQFF